MQIDQDRRRTILAALSLAQGYRLPLRVLRDTLDDVGYTATLDRVRTDCAWLAEQGFAELAGDVAALTDRGLDIALGRADAPGVQRPAPGQAASLREALTGAGTALARALNGS